MKLLSKLPDRSNNDSSLGIELLRSSKPALSSLVAARLLVYCGCKAVGFQGYHGAERGDGIKAS